MKTHWRPPNLSNVTPGGITDICAPMVEEMNSLKKETDFYKEALKARLEDGNKIDDHTWGIEGEKYYAVVKEKSARKLNIMKLRELLTDEQFESCFVETQPYKEVRFEKLERVPNE